MADYSEEEKMVLNYFFTNLDKPVFFAKNFHPEVWALMQARYSRSTEGMRESFLSLLKEDPKNYEQITEFIKNNEGGAVLDHAVNKAITFMDKWVLGYGHSSVAEGAVVGIGLEGISILATKVIEDNRLASYLEKSTRYVSFSASSVYLDPVLMQSEFKDEIKDYYAFLFRTYDELQPIVLDYVMKATPLESGQNEAAWKRACKARTFDNIRYLLPSAVSTYMGWTINARALAHGINKLLSHSLKEMNEIGELLQQEGKKALPSLLKYTGKNDYIAQTNQEMPSFVNQFSLPAVDAKERAKLVYGPSDADDLLAAAIMYRYSKTSFEEAYQKAKQFNASEKEELLKKYVEKLGDFDAPLRELEYPFFVFDVLMDFGSWRDLQRHRIMTQTNQELTTIFGYEIPPDIAPSGSKEKFDAVMKKADELYKKVSAKYPAQAQYLVPLGYRKRVLLGCNLRELFHVIKLRSAPAGHYSYKNLVREMNEELKAKHPLCAKFIKCHYEQTQLDRLKSEEKFEEKMKKLNQAKQ